MEMCIILYIYIIIMYGIMCAITMAVIYVQEYPTAALYLEDTWIIIII